MKKMVLLEVQVFEWEVDFHNAGCLDTGSQDVLLGGLILFGTEPVEIIQETVGKKKRQIINYSAAAAALFILVSSNSIIPFAIENA